MTTTAPFPSKESLVYNLVDINRPKCNKKPQELRLQLTTRCRQDRLQLWMNGTSESRAFSTTKHKSWISNGLLFKHKDLWRRGLMPRRDEMNYAEELQSLLWPNTTKPRSKCLTTEPVTTKIHSVVLHASSFRFHTDPNNHCIVSSTHCNISCSSVPRGRCIWPQGTHLTVWNVRVPVRTLFSSLAFSFNPEGADVRTVTFVVRRGPCQLQQHVTGGSRFS